MKKREKFQNSSHGLLGGLQGSFQDKSLQDSFQAGSQGNPQGGFQNRFPAAKQERETLASSQASKRDSSVFHGEGRGQKEEPSQKASEGTKGTEAENWGYQENHEEPNSSAEEGAAAMPKQKVASSLEAEEEEEKREGKEEAENALSEARREIDGLKEAWSRERAEFINFRKRIAHDRERQRNEVTANFVQALLPVLDNLNQVLQVDTENEEVKKYVSGVKMIRQNFVTLLTAFGIKEIKPFNEAFDPQSMEAIMSEEAANLSEETVLEVFQAGYIMDIGEAKSQLIRAAKVKVGKPLPVKNEKGK